MKSVFLIGAPSTGAHVPLSNERFSRMRRLVPDLLFMIYNSEELVSTLQMTRALTVVDCEELRLDRTNCKKNSMLINAILRRSDYSFEQLREALIRTKQEHIAEALVQGKHQPPSTYTSLHPEIPGPCAEGQSTSVKKTGDGLFLFLFLPLNLLRDTMQGLLYALIKR